MRDGCLGCWLSPLQLGFATECISHTRRGILAYGPDICNKGILEYSFVFEPFLCDRYAELLYLACPYSRALAVALFVAVREAPDAIEERTQGRRTLVLGGDPTQKVEPKRSRNRVAQGFVLWSIGFLMNLTLLISPVADVYPSVRESLESCTLKVKAV